MKNPPLASGKQNITPEHPMKVQLLGAAQTVTGSCYMIEACGKRFCIDCGMHQGNKAIEERNRNPRPYAPGNIDFILVTHAHIDHSGLLPLMVREGFSKPIYCTKATSELLDIMLQDSAHIQEMEAQWEAKKYSRRGLKNPPAALYTTEDALKTAELLHPVAYHEDFEPAPGIKVTYYDAGHILGSGSLRLEVTEDDKTTSIIFSGDIGRPQALIVRDPESPPKADYIFMESTYGDRNHTEVWSYTEDLAKIIDDTMAKGGNVVIPAFAVGRTQELLYFIREIKDKQLVKSNPDFPVYIDSPLARRATTIFTGDLDGYLDADALALVQDGTHMFNFSNLRMTETVEESKGLNEDGIPKVIISASGMCDAGRIRHHLKHNLWKPECTIVFVGYQGEGTLGRSLLEGVRSVKLFGEEIAVHAKIVNFQGLSSHADRDHLLAWIADIKAPKPQHVFIVHGDREVAPYFAESVEKLGFTAHAPQYTEVYDLLEDQIVAPGYLPERKAKAVGGQRVSSAYERLVALGQRMVDVIRRSKGRDNKTLGRWADQLRQLLDKWEES